MSPLPRGSRVCDLTTLYTEGAESGVNTYLSEKARYFAGRPGVDHTIIVPGQAESRSRLFDSTLITVRSPALPWNREHRVLRDHRTVRRLLREAAPTVVEVDCAYTLGRVASSALRERDVPVVGFYHVHLPTFIARPAAARLGRWCGALVEHLAWTYTRFCCRPLDVIAVSSPDIHERLQRRGFTRLDRAPLGVDLALFRPAAAPAPRAASDRSRLLYVGRLSYEKDLATLLDAVTILNGRGDHALDVVGDGPLRKDLERRARSEPRISFLGFRPHGEELARLYASADLVVNPSPNETFSLTILEALASGTPVVAARSGGPMSLVAPEVGALAAPGDPHDLARCIEQVLARPPTPAACRRHVEDDRSWSRTFETLETIYERAVQRHGARAVPPPSDPVLSMRKG